MTGNYCTVQSCRWDHTLKRHRSSKRELKGSHRRRVRLKIPGIRRSLDNVLRLQSYWKWQIPFKLVPGDLRLDRILHCPLSMSLHLVGVMITFSKRCLIVLFAWRIWEPFKSLRNAKALLPTAVRIRALHGTFPSGLRWSCLETINSSWL